MREPKPDRVGTVTAGHAFGGDLEAVNASARDVVVEAKRRMG